MKVGRNDLCPCGSGKKYKRCCLQFQGVPEQAMKQIREAEHKRIHREKKFGKVRPIIHTDFKGQKFVVSGNTVHFNEKWKTFPDFLYDYVKTCFGKEFWLGEVEKPEVQRHPVLKWARAVSDQQKGESKKAEKDGLFSFQPVGEAWEYYQLGYDLYVLRDHLKLQGRMVHRLKIEDQFPGARYELYVVAIFIRAGFTIDYEDETDGSRKHPEFLAIHKETGQQFAVEAKKRNRSKPIDDDSNIKLGHWQNKAMHRLK